VGIPPLAGWLSALDVGRVFPVGEYPTIAFNEKSNASLLLEKQAGVTVVVF
jgi:hypothetical protein